MHSRRVARLTIGGVIGLPKSHVIMCLQQLPDDAVLLYAGDDRHSMGTFIVFESATLPEVPESHALPEFQIKLTAKGVPTPPAPIAAAPVCTCDAAYLGYRDHLKNCALNAG